MNDRSPRPAAPSLAALLGGIMKDAKDVLVQELTLAKLEGHDELDHIKTAALSLGIGVGVAAVGGILLSVRLVHVLAAYTDLPLWGCYGIVGSGFGGFCRKFCSGGHEGAVAPVCVGMRQRGRRTVRPQ